MTQLARYAFNSFKDTLARALCQRRARCSSCASAAVQHTPTGSTFRPDTKLQQVMAFAHGFTARVCCSMDSGGSEGGVQSLYYAENRAPMSSSDVTGLLIGLPKAGVIFLYNAPFSRESASAFLHMQNTHGSTHTIMFTLSKRASVPSQTEAPTPTGWTRTGSAKLPR